MMERPTRHEAAYALREQAASCRSLARRALTISGGVALDAVADTLDDDARRIDPLSERH
jgi:hypothetical protein